jgi:hypothetical protein
MGNKPLVLHNRWFENDTDYYTQMKFPFVVEKGYALPLTEEPFIYFMSKASNWGLKVYEQDWLVDQFLNMDATQTDIALAENWMNNMNSAAQKSGVTIQLCMPLPCHVLQTVAMNQVTQIRASGDYQRQAYDKNQWSIGYTSILHDSLGVFPFKDCFWSNSSVQTGCSSSVCQEPNADLETLVSLLSAGPVAPADRIGYLSTVNLMQTTRTDGVLLKPDAPARTMDLAFSLGFKGTPTLLNLTSASSSHTLQDGQTNPPFTWHYILAGDTLQQITITPSDLGEKDDGFLYVFDYFQKPLMLSHFSETSPLVIPALRPSGDTVSFKYYVVFRATKSYSMIGEHGKYAVASGQRIFSMSQTSAAGRTTSNWSFYGAANEEVVFDLLHTPSGKIESVTCHVTSISSTLVCIETQTALSCNC